MTTGCYGEYDSHWVEPMVLEALMNGAGGILYFLVGRITSGDGLDPEIIDKCF